MHLAAIVWTVAGTAAVLAHPGVAQAPVNDGLGLDWAALDGSQVLYKSPWIQERQTTTIVRYALEQGEAGPTLIVTTEMRVRAEKFVGGSKEVGVDSDTVWLVASSPSHLEEHFTRASSDKRAPSGSNSLIIGSGRFELRSSWTTGDSAVRGSAPPGLLAPTLEYAAIAALPDSLPKSVALWFFNLDTQHPEAIKVDFGKRKKVRVPLAAAGTECGENARVGDTTVAAVQAVVHQGGHDYPADLLAQRPHLIVGKDFGVKCLALHAGSAHSQ
jgi:hypothetical protein